MLGKDDKVYFAEINPRKTGHALEDIYTHELTKPKGFPSLPELEFKAVSGESFADLKLKEMKPGDFCWALSSQRADKGSIVTDDIKTEDEMNIFKKQTAGICGMPRKGTRLTNKL